MKLQFNVACYTSLGQHVGVCGGGALGDWDIRKCLLLKPTEYPIWSGEIELEQPTEFKYVLLRLRSEEEGVGSAALERWEFEGQNRQMDLVEEGSAVLVVLNQHFGDSARNQVEMISEDAGDTASDVCAQSKDAGAVPQDMPLGRPAAQADPTPVERVKRMRSRGVLSKVDVDPSTRFARLVRSSEGVSFSAKYDVHAMHILGTGMSGGVCTATHRASGAQVAVKTLSTKGLSRQKHEQIIAEVQNQLQLDHPNICRLLEVHEEPDCLKLVLERMRGPDLYEKWARKGKYTELDAKHCVRQVLSAVAYCHRHGVCHRDLKLDNFCLEDDSEQSRIKMIDFGLSASTSLPMTDAVGTLFYVAPEVLKSQYTEKCDMWSLGVMTYILLDGRAPFHGIDDRQTFKRIQSGLYSCPKQRWSHISAAARDFVAKLLVVDPDARMCAEEALVHLWVSVNDEEASDSETIPLDPEVLQSMQRFAQSNALKRAVMNVVAPTATIEQVSKLADQFELLDEQKTGMVPVRDLAQKLTEIAGLTEAEVAAISTALVSDDQADQISYSAFLAACLAEKVKDAELRELFERLDADANGHLSVEELSATLGDVINPELLAAEMNGRSMSYNDFKWLLHMPHLGATIDGLRKCLSSLGSTRKDWRQATVRAKADSSVEEAIEAARQENLSWRVWYRQLANGQQPAGPGEAEPEAGLHYPEQQDADEILKSLGETEEELKSHWCTATCQAKSGDIEAARKENLAWRKLNMNTNSAE